MKKILPVILILSFSINLSAQSEKQKDNWKKQFEELKQRNGNEQRQSSNFRSNTSNKMRLDSIKDYGDGVSKILFFYDANERDTLDLFYIWDTISSGWANYWKIRYQYDSYGNDTIEITYDWDTINNEWFDGDSTITTYFFDENGNDTAVYINNYLGDEKHLKYFDADGKDTMELVYSWDINNNPPQWRQDEKHIYTYDVNNNLIQDFQYSWDNINGSWKKNWKINHYYDSYGNDTLERNYYYNTIQNTFVGDVYYKYRYNLNYTRENIISVFNSPNMLAEYTAYQGDDSFYYWDTLYYSNVNDCNTLYTTSYDNVQNTFTLSVDTSDVTSYLWDFGDGFTSSASTPTHNYSKDSIYNVCLKITTTSNDTCTYCHSIGKDNLGNIYRTAGFALKVVGYSPYTSISQTDNIEKIISISPNPADDYITINTNVNAKLNFELISIDGKQVLQQTINNTTRISLENLPTGLYIYKISGNDGLIQTGKLAIQ